MVGKLLRKSTWQFSLACSINHNEFNLDVDKEDLKPIEQILQNVTHLTTLALEEQKQNRYEEEKSDITLQDIAYYKHKRKGFYKK